jgi:hypothetical protein
MSRQIIAQFMAGALVLAFWAIGYFFLRFWKKTRDRFFRVFAWAFWVLAIERVILLFIRAAEFEFDPRIYLVRLTAFLLILWAIFEKNRSASPPPQG